MYLAATRGSIGAGSRGRGLKFVSANVIALGTVSLITDISSEMVTAILPIYLVMGLQLSPLAYGVIDGGYTGATAVLRIAGGYLADRFRRRKLLAGIGYGLSALAKLGLLAVGGSAPGIGWMVAVDRTGKGIRTAPRDALITASTPPAALGGAFGVHRAMDGIGAFLGPLVAVVVLLGAGQAYDAVFVTSFCFAAMAVVVLVLFVRDPPTTAANGATVSAREAVRLVRAAPVRRLVAAAAVLGLATIGDGFVYLLLQRRTGLGVAWFPLLAVGTSLGYLALATPLGLLADRVGRQAVLIGGYVALILVYLLLLVPGGGWAMIALILGLYGLFYAATDGVLMALAGPRLPEHLRTTGIALVQTSQAITYVGSSVLFGLGWYLWGPTSAVLMAAAIAIGSALLTLVLLRGVLS